MRLGILGGSFDPVHYGHLLLAESCREQARLDQVWFLPSAVPPHKQEQQLAPAAHRVEMLQLAIAGYAAFSVCTFEVDRGGVNYTVDTLAHLGQEDPSRELFFLLGADALLELHGWKDSARICQLATLVVVGRAGDLHFGEGSSVTDWSRLEGVLQRAQIDAIGRHQVWMPRVDLSSSEIRHRVGECKSIRYRTPRAVEKYIETHEIYRTKA